MSEQSGEFTQNSRFGEKQLETNPDAPIRHFRPLPLTEGQTVQRDRFGNRLFTSPEKSYNDRENEENKAALLVSPKGEAFIKANLGILQDIDRGLQSLNVEEKRGSVNSDLSEIDLGNGRKLEALTIPGKTEGSQSVVFLLQTETGKYAVKVMKHIPIESTPISQPYSNEMLQTQAIALDLRDELAQQDIEMPTFLFASGQVSCTEFVEGECPQPDEWAPHISRIHPQIASYIAAQREQGNTLWNGTTLDFYQPHAYMEDRLVLRTDNVIKRPDGKFVPVDYIIMDDSYVRAHLSAEDKAEGRRKRLEDLNRPI
jgi:hypothetical protein